MLAFLVSVNDNNLGSVFTECSVCSVAMRSYDLHDEGAPRDYREDRKVIYGLLGLASLKSSRWMESPLNQFLGKFDSNLVTLSSCSGSERILIFGIGAHTTNQLVLFVQKIANIYVQVISGKVRELLCHFMSFLVQFDFACFSRFGSNDH